MAAKKNKTQKALNKAIKKTAKKNPTALIVIIVLLLVVAVVVGVILIVKYTNDQKHAHDHDTVLKLNGQEKTYVQIGGTYVEQGAIATYKGEDVSSEIVTTYFDSANATVTAIDTAVEATFYVKYAISHEDWNAEIKRTVIVSDVASMDINFLELGNKYTGDSTFIKAGDVDILIDAGSRNGSSKTIGDFIDQYCTDGKLEYVIATHAHQDHIAGFVGTNAAPGVFDRYEVETIIDFALSNQMTADKPTEVYKNYVAKRDAEVASGAKHYTALECCNETNGAKKVYDIAPGITMEILYQKFYENTTGDENDYSVCTLFTQGSNKYLLTGDLEAAGERSLVESNTLPKVQLFKGAHHGSYTANTDALLSVIQPEVVCICCCAGSDEYTKTPENMFPAQAAINRLGVYTDKIYVTTVVADDEKGFQSMNGNICFHSDSGSTYTVTGSNNNTILKDTAWFKSNRTWPTV